MILKDMTGLECYVKEIWLDFGAGIKGENIIVKDTRHQPSASNWDYQLLCPRDLDEVSVGIFTFDDVQRIIDKMNERGW